MTIMNMGKTVVVLCAVVLSLAGCKAKAGDACQAGRYSCSDPKTGLFCGADGKLATMSCSGGCRVSGNDVTCENSIAEVNDGCAQVGDLACTSDRKNAIECGKDNKFAVTETCKGPRGCMVTGDVIECDNDTSDVNDPCRTPNDYACTSDKGMVLRCDDHKMAALNSCRGPKACRVFELPQEKKVDFVCDDSLAEEGDPCDTNGEEACAMNKKGMYVCRSNKFADFRACPGPSGCTYEERGDKYACDVGSKSPTASASAAPGGGAPAPSHAASAAPAGSAPAPLHAANKVTKGK